VKTIKSLLRTNSAGRDTFSINGNKNRLRVDNRAGEAESVASKITVGVLIAIVVALIGLAIKEVLHIEIDS